MARANPVRRALLESTAACAAAIGPALPARPARAPQRRVGSRRATQGGFTLIEVLIAVVIAAIGLLGVAALQLSTLKSTDGSRYRSLAIQLTGDMADRLRANTGGSIQGAVINQGYNRPRTAPGDTAYNTPTAACRSTGCQPGDMAMDDLANWQRRITASLPGGIGVVCIDSGTLGAPRFDGTTLDPRCDNLGVAYAVKILWLDDRSESARASNTADAYSAFVTRVNPTF
jgi:type IV pilus assembly protein PilV